MQAKEKSDNTGDGDSGDGNTGDGSSDGNTGDDSGGSGSNGNGIMAVGLLALLMHYGLDFDESESELGHYYTFDSGSAKNRSRRTSVVSGTLGHDSGTWVRPAQSRFTSHGSSYFGAVSNRMSWDIQQSGDYFLRASISPASSVSPNGWQSSASGDTLSLTGGWHGDERRLQLGITHGRYDANAKLYDSSTKGNLFGESEFVHTSVHASAVQELTGGPMKLSSSASLMAGQVEQAPYAAENVVMKAKVPSYRQSYTGFRLGFSAKSRKWLELSDGTSLKPHLKFSALRTRSSASDPVQMRQSDKVGALSFQYESVLQGVPQVAQFAGYRCRCEADRFARRLASGVCWHASRRRVSARGSGSLPHAVLIDTQHTKKSLAGGRLCGMPPLLWMLLITLHSGG